MANLRILTYAELRRMKPCAGTTPRARKLFGGEGIPLTLEAAEKAQAVGLDAMWVGVRLLTPEQRAEFIRFSLAQRQPHLVSLFQQAGLPEHASAIAAQDFSSAEGCMAAIPIFYAARAAGDAWAAGAAAGAAAWAARDAAGDAAWDAAWAARDAAGDAAWAARDAAGDAAWAAARREQIQWILGMINRHAED